MFRRIRNRLFPKELDSCFSCLFKRRRNTSDEDLEEMCAAEMTTAESQPPATLMAGLEETNDTEKMNNCPRLLTQHHNQPDFFDNYVAVVENMATQKSTSSRIGACRILFAFYGHVSPQAKDETWKILNRLSVDDNIRVRRMVVTILGNFAKQYDVQPNMSFIIPILEKLAEEKDESCVAAAQLVTYICKWPHIPEPARLAIIPVLLKYARHTSWKVRYMIANNINEVQKALRAHILKSGLSAVLPNLLKDMDPRVRDAADNQFQAYCKYLIESRNKDYS